MKLTQDEIVEGERKTLKNYPDFEIDKRGNVFSKERLRRGKNNLYYLHKPSHKPLKQWINKYGYPEITLRSYLGGFTRKDSIGVYRLVAETFIPNPLRKKCVNHISGNKLDHSVENLEWVTHSENELHSYRVLGKKHNRPGLGKFGVNAFVSKQVKSVDKNKNITYFGSLLEAGKSINMSSNSVSDYCKSGKLLKKKGLRFMIVSKKEYERNRLRTKGLNISGAYMIEKGKKTKIFEYKLVK